MSVFTKAALPVLLAASLLSGCATHSDGSAPLNQRTWPICSLLGGAVGGGLGAIESSAWAGRPFWSVMEMPWPLTATGKAWCNWRWKTRDVGAMDMRALLRVVKTTAV